jgi:two-component system, chemotaxis family, chemotaxis protein CheY
MTRKPTVLFVDDEPTTRRMYEYRFASLGIPHYIADSAEAAVRILEEKTVDIVVTDLLMPRYDGTDLVVCMREAEYTRKIPIILFTTGGNEEKITQAMKAGASEVLPKQTTPPDKLIARIYALTGASSDASRP